MKNGQKKRLNLFLARSLETLDPSLSSLNAGDVIYSNNLRIIQTSSMNFTDVESDSLPPVAAHLFSLAATFSSRQHHRSAALAYASASRASGTTVYQQAVALYLAARHLFYSLRTTSDDDIQAEDRARAVGYLQKCRLLSRDLPSSVAFICTMQSLALVERISTHVKDDLGAAKTINRALNLISSGSENPQTQLLWWSYFRSKAISNALASGNSVQQAALVATESASVCERSRDLMSAAAFHLCQSQIALGASTAGFYNIKPAIKTALKCLSCVDSSTYHEMDSLLLNFAAQVLQSLTFIRAGDLRSLREQLVHLSKAYNGFHQARKQQQQRSKFHRPLWQWWPSHYLTAITYYIMTSVSRSTCEMRNAHVHSITALARIGIREDQLESFTLGDITISGVSPRATLSFAVALLENAARVRMTQVHLKEASVLIGAIVDLTFRDETARSYIRLTECDQLPNDVQLETIINTDCEEVGLVPRCTAFLLLGEYHNLRSRISAAQIATSFLGAVRLSASKSHECPPSDTLQVVASYISLIEGGDRAELANVFPVIDYQPSDKLEGISEELHASSRNFISAQVHALAWFTSGVFFMRNSDVIESRRALSNCLTIVNRSPFGNDQLIANASAVLSTIIIARERAIQEGVDMAKTAVDLSENLGDIVAMVRAKRQYKKAMNRVSQSQRERQEADQAASDAHEMFLERTSRGGIIFSEDLDK